MSRDLEQTTPEPERQEEPTTDSPRSPVDDAPAAFEETSRWRLGRSRREKDEPEADGDEESLSDRITQQIASQWALIRAERAADQRPLPVRGGESDFRTARVPFGLDLAAAWAWRFLVIGAALFTVLWLLYQFLVVTLPLAIALLLAALASPGVRMLRRIGLSKSLAPLVVMVVGLFCVGMLLTFVGQQVAQGSEDLANSVVKGLGQIRGWLREGPLSASDSQINSYLKQVQDMITTHSQDGRLVTQVTEVGTALGHLLAGFFIILFSTYFFMADGDRIWSWFVRLAPRVARERVDSSGRVAWGSLTQFVRATVMIALVDAVGIMLVAAALGVPFVLAIGVLVFLGAFIPMVGATVAGGVAVLVALVDQGPWVALWMLVGVVVVQQVEGHVLQPFLMGRFVAVHPLGVIIAIALGVIVAGVPGALIAVPLVAVVNAVVLHLAEAGTPDDPATLYDPTSVEAARGSV